MWAGQISVTRTQPLFVRPLRAFCIQMTTTRPLVICRIQNPDISRAGRTGPAHGGGAGGADRGGQGRGGSRRDGGGSIRQENRPSCRSGHRRRHFWTYLARCEQTKSHVNRIEKHNERVPSGLSLGPRPLCVLTANKKTDAFLVSVKYVHARHVRE